MAATTLVLAERTECALKVVTVGGRYYLVRTRSDRINYDVIGGYATRRLADIALSARIRYTLGV
jgi:hypothetical protein